MTNNTQVDRQDRQIQKKKRKKNDWARKIIKWKHKKDDRQAIENGVQKIREYVEMNMSNKRGYDQTLAKYNWQRNWIENIGYRDNKTEEIHMGWARIRSNEDIYIYKETKT